MKAAFHTAAKEITIREVPDPQPGPGEYLVRIKACAICGSDTWWNAPARENEPIHGHESAGEVVACGPGATRFKPGDRVVCYAILGCGKCDACARGLPTLCGQKRFVEGGFAEMAVFHERLLFPCPEEYDFVTASLLSDAIGVPLRGLRRLRPALDDRVAVWGLGPLGLLQIAFLKAAGVGTIIGVDPVASRLETARAWGAAAGVNPTTEKVADRIRELTGGRGADKIYTYVRAAAVLPEIFRASAENATICTFVGLNGSFDLPEWWERSLVWSFYFNPGEYEPNLEFLRTHRIDLRPVVSDVTPFAEINSAFAKRFEHPEASLKVVINF